MREKQKPLYYSPAMLIFVVLCNISKKSIFIWNKEYLVGVLFDSFVNSVVKLFYNFLGKFASRVCTLYFLMGTYTLVIVTIEREFK